MVKKILIIMLMAGWGGLAIAQQRDTTRNDVSDELERALEDFDPDDLDTENEQIIQYLQDLAENPVNVNRADLDELLGVPGMNLRLAREIIDHRANEGPFESVSELSEVPGIGSVTLGKMQSYMTVSSGMVFSDLYRDYRYWINDGSLEVFSRYQRTLQEQAGYQRDKDDGGFVGSPGRYYQRFKYQSNHLSVNFTQEKDPGEILDGLTGFDYNSWHVALEDNGRLRQLVVGDYDLSFGQGLVLWDGASFGKGSAVIGSASRSERGVSPYASAQETNGYRGVAATYGRQLQLTGFYSLRPRTASVIAEDTTRFPRTTGLVQTKNDLAVHNNTKHELYGGRVRWELPAGFIGVTGYKTVFDKYILPGTAVYNKHDFEGTNNTAFGIDYKLLAGPALIFGEMARTKNGGLGWITGIESPIGDDTDFSVAYRNYQQRFQSILGSGFGEGSGQPKNEIGMYAGLRHNLNEKVTLSAYMDQFRFPTPRFGTSQPTRGFDWLALGEVELNPNLNFYLQVRSETNDSEYEDTDPFGRTVTSLGKEQRSSMRGQLAYWVNEKVRLRNRGEVVRSVAAGESFKYGYLLYQDLRLVPNAKWTVDARATMFHTDGFDSRVYQFENDLLYVMSSQMLSGIGQRLYILIHFEPFDYLQIWGKYGTTIFENEQLIGSGLNEINGNRRSDIGLQIRMLF